MTAKELNTIRQNKNWTYQDLANVLGIKIAYSKWLCTHVKKVPAKHAKAIAEYAKIQQIKQNYVQTITPTKINQEIVSLSKRIEQVKQVLLNYEKQLGISYE